MAYENTPAAAFDEVVLGWMAPEFMRFERGRLWFALLILLNGALVAYAFFTGSITMMVVFIVLPLVLLLEHRKKPKAVQVIFSPYGVKFGVLRLPYSSLKAFAVLHNPPMTDELHLMTNRKSHPEVVIPLMGMNPATVRQFLVTQIPEQEGKQLTFLDALVRILRLN
ncbi:MAG: hypothetical protein AAB383_04565 [Patescibacteria group bacterium]